jgi:hypothetical protein
VQAGRQSRIDNTESGIHVLHLLNSILAKQFVIQRRLEPALICDLVVNPGISRLDCPDFAITFFKKVGYEGPADEAASARDNDNVFPIHV